MDTATVNLIAILLGRAESLRAAGNLHEALHSVNAAVQKCQHLLSPNLDDIDAFATALEKRGDIYREIRSCELARDDYRQAIDQLDNRPDRFAQIGRIHAALGAAEDELEHEEKAVHHWQKAIEFFERNEPPLLLDIAAIANNLGVVTKARGDLETAEAYFLRALEILHSLLGQEHEQTATVSSNLGALYQAARFDEQARELHMIALETRHRLLGDEHPDTAQSHNNLALALLRTGDRAWARRHFESAFASYEVLSGEYAADLEAVSSNYCDFLRDEGEDQLAELIEGRTRDAVESSAAY